MYFNHYEMYFGLKFPPSPSIIKSPKYSDNLTFGTPQQTEVQQLGRIVSLFFETPISFGTLPFKVTAPH